MAENVARQPGRRGQATRQRLLEATSELLQTTSWRSVKVTDIARQAGTSPATFYQYFENVESAIAAIAEEMVAEAAEVAELVSGDWSPGASWTTAVAITDGFLRYWEANRVIFRVVDLSTDLRGVRVRALNAVTVALAAAVDRNAPEVSGRDPMSVAGNLVAMFSSVAAHRYGFEFWGIHTDDLMDAQARLLHWAVTGRTPTP